MKTLNDKHYIEYYWYGSYTKKNIIVFPTHYDIFIWQINFNGIEIFHERNSSTTKVNCWEDSWQIWLLKTMTYSIDKNGREEL